MCIYMTSSYMTRADQVKYICICLYIYIYIYVYNLCVCVYIYTCVCVCVCVYVYIYKVGSGTKDFRLRIDRGKKNGQTARKKSKPKINFKSPNYGGWQRFVGSLKI